MGLFLFFFRRHFCSLCNLNAGRHALNTVVFNCSCRHNKQTQKIPLIFYKQRLTSCNKTQLYTVHVRWNFCPLHQNQFIRSSSACTTAKQMDCWEYPSFFILYQFCNWIFIYVFHILLMDFISFFECFQLKFVHVALLTQCRSTVLVEVWAQHCCLGL